jgi:hypothetical protein
MEKGSRRKFVKNTAHVASGVALLGATRIFSSCYKTSILMENLDVFIPMPIQVVIDDVGWWSGEDGSQRQEPYRTGIQRNHVPADYQAIVDMGRMLGIRPQAAMILCEWDQENILRQLPTSTWMGDDWDNSRWVGPWLDEAAAIIRNNRGHFELTVHGVGHEYWIDGNFTRAEWTDSKGQMRPPDQIEKHLDYFERLLNQHQLGSFPKSFVPAAFRHSFGPSEGKNVSLAELLNKKGINYINSPLSSMYNRERVQYGCFGIDAGVMTIDRGSDEFEWDVFPGNPSREINGPTCGMHWPNLLHPDPGMNLEVVRKWVDYLKPYDDKPDRMLAPDSEAFQHQLAHHVLTNTRLEENSIILDFTKTDLLPGSMGKTSFAIKLKSKNPVLKFKSNGIKIISDTSKRENEIIYTLHLERESGRSMARILLS